MKKLFIAAMAAIALSTSACASLPVHGVHDATETISLRADQGLTIAALTYQGWATAIVAARPHLTDAQWHDLQATDRRLYAALERAEAGVESAQSVLDAISAAAAALPRPNPQPSQ